MPPDAPAENTVLPVARAQKAAMIVQLLLREGGDLPLSDLPEQAQTRLTRELAALKLINKETLDQVALEFTAELSKIALTPPGDVENVLRSLDGRISTSAAARLREEAASQAGRDPWLQLLALEAEDLVPICEAESHEISAIMMSKLPTAKAAALMGLLAGDKARRIAFAISKTAAVRPDMVARIGAALSQAYCGSDASAFADAPEHRIGAILNSSPAATRDALLEALLSEDRTLGEGVRKAIFTFADIAARLAAEDVPKVTRDVDQADLVRALASATADGGPLAASAEHILENMSQRMSDALREEMAEAGKIKLPEAELAQAAVVKAIRDAADEGTIQLRSEDDEEED